jgi:hypothetical protein
MSEMNVLETWKRSTTAFLIFTLIAMFTIVQPTSADDTTDLAKQSQNPVGSLISVPLENNFYFGIGPKDAFWYVLNLKPVYPVNLGNLNLINRFILPVIYQEGQGVSVPEDIDLGPIGAALSKDSEFGLGDLTWQGFLSPAEPGNVIWGAGPVLILPTATDAQLGSEKWSAGATGLLLAMPGAWLVGGLVQNVWSFAGSDTRSDVNKFLFQYFLNYNMDGGWYLTSSPVITANWEANSDNRWTVPFGGGVGRLVRYGKQPVDYKLAAYYNVEAPMMGPDWNLQFTVKFLFPK